MPAEELFAADALPAEPFGAGALPALPDGPAAPVGVPLSGLALAAAPPVLGRFAPFASLAATAAAYSGSRGEYFGGSRCFHRPLPRTTAMPGSAGFGGPAGIAAGFGAAAALGGLGSLGGLGALGLGGAFGLGGGFGFAAAACIGNGGAIPMWNAIVCAAVGITGRWLN